MAYDPCSTRTSSARGAWEWSSVGNPGTPCRIWWNGTVQKSYEATSGLDLASSHGPSVHNHRYGVKPRARATSVSITAAAAPRHAEARIVHRLSIIPPKYNESINTMKPIATPPVRRGTRKNTKATTKAPPAAMRQAVIASFPLGSTKFTGSSFAYRYRLSEVGLSRLPRTGSCWDQRPKPGL